MLAGKKICIGVTGGIAAYKSAELVRALIKQQAQVRVMMTRAATRFVSPLTFETLTEHPVLCEMFPDRGETGTVHIDWARWPDVIVISPATANTVAKIAMGFADNALTTTVLASTTPLIICPAMNKDMYANAAYQANHHTLIARGVTLVDPGQGELACGEVGWGRLADKEDIVDALKLISEQKKDLIGKTVTVTAGPTREPIDAVRFLSNRSSGKMGYAIAERAACRGATVHLITGPTVERPFRGVSVTRVGNAGEMEKAVRDVIASTDILVMSAAVSDFRPHTAQARKIKKSDLRKDAVLKLTENPDILQSVSDLKTGRIYVGFSVETDSVIENSRAKLENKNLDLIVINNPLEKGAGFDVDTNKVTLLDRDGKQETLPLLKKIHVADRLFDKVATFLS